MEGSPGAGAVGRPGVAGPLTAAAAGLAAAGLALVGPPQLGLLLVVAVAVAAAGATAGRSVLSWPVLIGALLVVVMLIPIRRYTLPIGGPVQLEPYRLLIVGVAGMWVASLLADPRVRLRGTGLGPPLALFALALVLSEIPNWGRISTQGITADVVKGLTFTLSFLLVVYMIASLVDDWSVVDGLVTLVVACAAAVALAAVVESRTHDNVFDHLRTVLPVLQMDYAEVASSRLRGGRLRVSASAQHPIALGALMAMLIPFCLYLVHRGRRRLGVAAAGLLGVAIVATVSRTAILMLVVETVVLWRLRRDMVRRALPYVLPALIAVHAVMPGALGALRTAFFPKGGVVAEQQGAEGTRGQGRVADLGPGISEWWTRPLVGQGFASRVTDREKANAQILDNQWLGLLLETGVIGVAGLLWAVARSARRLARRSRGDPGPRGTLLAATAAAVVGYAVGMFTFDSFEFIQVTFMFFIVLALGAAALRLAGPGEEATCASS